MRRFAYVETPMQNVPSNVYYAQRTSADFGSNRNGASRI
jgi:hypothetical protein